MAGINKKTKIDRYYEWMKKNHRDGENFAKHREELIKELSELSSM